MKPIPCRTCDCEEPCPLGEAWLEEQRDPGPGSDWESDRAADRYERWLDSRW